MLTATMANSPRESRNFSIGGQHPLDEIAELTQCMKFATRLKVNLHVFSYERYPDTWDLAYIENCDAKPGDCSHVLRRLTQTADMHCKEIVATATNIFDDTLPPDEWLLTWYEKNGFCREPTNPPHVKIRRSARGLTGA